MLIPLLFASLILFGSLAIIFSFLWEQNRKKLKEIEKELTRQLYELNILRDLNDKIGYSLKTRDIARNIALTSEKFFPLKTASYAVVQDAQIIFESFTKGNVSEKYAQEVKKIVFESIYTLDDTLKHFSVTEIPSQVLKENELLVDNNTSSDMVPKSYFNIPLVLNNKLVGIISITSPKEKVYQDKDMSLLYKIVNQAQLAIGRLENVIETEKGKIQSLIYSLSSGAILFMNDSEGNLNLVTLNNAARNFLHLEGALDAQIVISQFKFEGNMVAEVRSVMEKKEMKLFRGMELYDKRLNLYITPVFDNATLNVIGVAITLQDVTLEYESEKLRENFTNMIVHELRAPLSSIRVSAELLVSNKVEDSEKAKMLQTIMASSERMLNDVNQLLDAARIQSGKFQADIKPADITGIIEERIKMFRILAEKRHISLDIEKVGEVPIFNFDALRIGQIMNNLLSNAIKYNHDGGSVKVIAEVEGKNFRMSVEDNGIGISKTLQDKLFTQFYQTSSEHRGTGTGLGLYITKAIVEAHGGKIELKSEEGRGTKVTFEIPMVGIQVEQPENIESQAMDKLYLN
jgi:signal transduction histidine kinase